MDLETMYKGIAFSPTAVITTNISATDTMIPVNDVDAFPDAPNIATIGVDAGAETIIYNGKTSNMLTGCTRGIEGVAKDWEEGTVLGRNFTAKDHSDMVENIKKLGEEKLDVEFKVEVTNSNEMTITGKALDATQNNKEIEGSLAYRIENIEMPKGTSLQLEDLRLNDTDFSTTDLSGNIEKIMNNMGPYRHLLGATIDGINPSRNLDASISNYLGIAPVREWWTVEITTNKDELLPNIVNLYANSSNSYFYRFHYDNELRFLGKMVYERTVPITNAMLKNEWTFYNPSAWDSKYVVQGGVIIMSLMLKNGVLANSTVVVEGLPTVTKKQFIHGDSWDQGSVRLAYLPSGSLIIDTSKTLSPSTWFNFNGTIFIE